MNARERFQAAAALFLEAGKLPEAEVPAFLDSRCGGDVELRAQVEAMLAARDDESIFRTLAQRMDTLHAGLRARHGDSESVTLDPHAPGAARFAEERAGDVIDRFRLLERIGEGGFGTVWVAEQREPVQRRVALKIIKAGMDTRQVVARFEQERQALAVMDHPSIAKVFDAGATVTGRPYFVMELCKGQPISVYCDAQQLSIRERLELFAQVCAGVQHAHTKGVIHRDLKPSNILVMTQDGRPTAKIIDFGIAKATGERLTERTLFTEHRQLIGTPEYMSPEQAEGSLDIDTRTDVYSLGVLLYELLIGSTPFDGKELRSAAYGEIQRIIREVDPPRPSTRLAQHTARLSEIAARRRTAPERLNGAVRGELDWIAMKALEKDRARRYESASDLAQDVRRYLNGEAVLAAPPGAIYRARKFVRRHKAGVTLVSAVGVALMAGMAGFAWQAGEASRERDRAVRAEAEARVRADEAQKVADFQGAMLSQVDPSAAGIRLTGDVRARLESALAATGTADDERARTLEAFASAWARINATDAAMELIDGAILRPASQAIDTQFRDQPIVAARLRRVLGERYVDLGRYDAAWSLQSRAIETLRSRLGDEDPETLAGVTSMSRLRSRKGELDGLDATLRATADAQQRVSGRDDPARLETLSTLGEVLLLQGKATEAEPVLRECLEARRELLGDDDVLTMESIANMAYALRVQAKYAEAEPLEREALERRRRVLGEDHPHTLGSLNNLGALLFQTQRLGEAEAAFRDVTARRRKVLGDAHPDTLQSLGNLSTTLTVMGKPEAAEALARETLDLLTRGLGADHPHTLNAQAELGVLLVNLGRAAEAEQHCRIALEGRLRTLGPKHPSSLASMNVMSYVLRHQGKHAEAEPFLRQALEASEALLGADHPDRLVFLINMGSLQMTLGQPEQAQATLRDALERATRTLGDAHPSTVAARRQLASVLLESGAFDDAVSVLTAAEQVARRQENGPDDASLAGLLLDLGRAQRGAGALASAEASLLEAHRRLRDSKGATSPGARRAAQALADLYEEWNRAEPEDEREASRARWAAEVESIDRASKESTTTP
jgi:eukaryotic-like serine/threonine-protein kinase